MRAFSCAACEVAHLDFPEEVGRTVFGLHGFGALETFATDRHLAIVRAVIHGESDDAVASSMNSETTEKFYRGDSACSAQ